MHKLARQNNTDLTFDEEVVQGERNSENLQIKQPYYDGYISALEIFCTRSI
jgi:hypothetical protein